MIKSIVKGGSRENGELKKRTLAISFPLAKYATGDQTTWEDVQARFGGATPAETLVNIFNVAIDATEPK